MVELRQQISDEMNETTWAFLRRYQLQVDVAGHKANLGWTFRRLQLVLLEPMIVAALMEAARQRTPDPREPRFELDVSTLCASSLMGTQAPLTSARPAASAPPSGLLHLGRRVVGKIKRTLKGQPKRAQRASIPTDNVRRLFLVDAGEIFTSHIGEQPYCYQKYLDGLLDIENMAIADDELLVLYGPVDAVDQQRLAHPRVVLLGSLTEPADGQVSPLVEESLWMSCFGDTGKGRTAFQAVDEGEVRSIYAHILRDDLRLMAATARLLERFTTPLEIRIDSIDAKLFTVGQFIMRNFPQHTVVGIQKVLGPYTFSFNIRGQDDLIAQPAKMLAWSRFHAEKLEGHGWTCPIVPSCMYKLERYRPFRTLDRDPIKQRLGIPLDRPVVMFSVVSSIIGFSLVDRWQYYQMLAELAEVVRRTGCYVLFKPWPGEDTTILSAYVSTLFEGLPHQMMARDQTTYHNVELLRITDVLVTTLSSFIGEAFFFGAVPLLVNTAASEAYFSAEYTAALRKMCVVKEEGASLVDVLQPVLTSSAEMHEAFRVQSYPAFAYLFGEVS